MQAWPAKATGSFLPAGAGLSVRNNSSQLSTSLTYLTFSFIGGTVMKKL